MGKGNRPAPGGPRPDNRARPCSDHLGRTYSSVNAMCAAWRVNPNTFANRLRRGKSLQEALTTPADARASARPTTDHTGREFPSVKAMCEAWDLDVSTFRHRLELGMSLREALTVPKNATPSAKTAKDHTGQEFGSIQDMCKAWGIDYTLYANRVAHGWDTGRALTEPIRERSGTVPATDHLCRTFPSVTAMCREWGISPGVYKERLREGMDTEEALTMPNRPQEGRPVPSTDHTGRQFRSIREMCGEHGLNRTTFTSRRRDGWSLDRALNATAGTVADHTGRTFGTIAEMCAVWHINGRTYLARRKKGMSVEEALTTPVKPSPTATPSTDHTGRTFPSVKAMCGHWHVDPHTYAHRRAKGIGLEEALTTDRMPRTHKEKRT